MEAGEYALTRGTCFVARHLEVVAVAGLLWISWWILGAAEFRLFLLFVFFERTWPAASMRPACLIYLSTSNDNEARPRERSDRGRFLPIGKKACVSMCNIHSRFLLITRAVRGRFPQTQDLLKRASMG